MDLNKHIQRLHHPGTTMAKLAYVGRDANTSFFWGLSSFHGRTLKSGLDRPHGGILRGSLPPMPPGRDSRQAGPVKGSGGHALTYLEDPRTDGCIRGS